MHRSIAADLESKRLADSYLFAGPDAETLLQAALEFAKKISGSPNEVFVLDFKTQTELLALKPDEAARQKDYRIESIRLLVSRSQLSTLDSKKKVFIIDGAEDLSPAAANALLKSLEEASKHAVWILLSQSSERMLPTVLSRCRKVNFAEGPAESMEIDEESFSKLPKSALSLSAQVLAAGKKIGGRRAAEQFLRALSLKLSEDLRRAPTPARADSLLAVLNAQQDLARNVSPQAVLDLALLSVKP